MKIRKEITENTYFSVSNAFVDEFIDKLSGNAVKLYLLILSQFENGGIMYDLDACKKLRISNEEYEAAVKELNDWGVISYEKGNCIDITAAENLKNCKKEHISRRFDEKKNEDKGFAEEYRNVISTISKEFFGGKMPIRWLNAIEKYAKEYGFMPETIYLLFAECEKIKEKSTSGYTSYVNKVAESWYRNKVVTPDDVARLSEEWNRKNAYVGFVKKKLNFARNFTEAEIKTILSWQEAGISSEMLAALLDDTNRVSAFTIEKIDNVVSAWKEAGVKTPEEAKAFRLAKKPAKEGTKPKTTNTKAHFENERKYSDDYLNELLKRDENGGAK